MLAFKNNKTDRVPVLPTYGLLSAFTHHKMKGLITIKICRKQTCPHSTMSPVAVASDTGWVHSTDSSRPTGYVARPSTPKPRHARAMNTAEKEGDWLN